MLHRAPKIGPTPQPPGRKWEDLGVTASGIPQVTIDQVPAQPVILDVREDDEWAAGHVDGAVHVPLADIPARLDEVPRDLEDGAPVVVVCRGGGRSARATAWLVSQGIDAVNLDGGMIAWAGAGRSMVSDSDTPPSVL